VEDRAGAEPDPELLRPARAARRAAARGRAAAAASSGSEEEGPPDAEEEASGSGSEGAGSGSDGGRGEARARRARRRGADARGGGEPDAAGPGPGSGGGRAPVWSDPADGDVTVDISAKARLRKLRADKTQTVVSGAAYEAALRKQHAAIYGAATWAALPAEGLARRRRRGGGERGEGSESGSDADADADAEQALLRSAGGLLAGRAAHAGGALPAGTLEASQLRDANGAAPAAAVVRSVEFHPNGQLLLAAGFDKKLRLFSVDGLRNPLLQALHLSDCPIQKAAFAAGGGAVVAAGRRPFYYVADLNAGAVERVLAPPGLLVSGGAAATGGPPAGPGGGRRRGRGGGGEAGGGGGGAGHARGPRSLESFAVLNREDTPLVAFLGDGGHVGIVSLRGRQAAGGVKLNGSARAAAFTDDGLQLLTAGGDGVVYTWDMRTRRCLSALRDEGSVGAGALAVHGGADGGWLAAAGGGGAVNLYRRTPVLEAAWGDVGGWPGGGGGGGGFAAPPGKAAPHRSLMQLTTAVDTLSFSGDGQVRLAARGPRRGLVTRMWPAQPNPPHASHPPAPPPPRCS
jgi:U3 small nucleolar RNA-associated protein 18